MTQPTTRQSNPPPITYNRRNVPIWALSQLDKIQSMYSKPTMIQAIAIDQGTQFSRVRIVVFLPKEGYYFGYLTKETAPNHSDSVHIPPLYYAYE